jgi:hypothetical protein
LSDPRGGGGPVLIEHPGGPFYAWRNDNYWTDNYGVNTIRFYAVHTTDLFATSLTWDNANGGANFSYEVRYNVLTNGTTAKLFWATGPTTANIISTTPIFTRNIPVGALGPSGVVHVPSAAFATQPAAATHVVLVLDPDNLVAEPIEYNNTIALAIPQIDLAAVKLDLDLTAANAVCTYSISGNTVPTGARIGVYWAKGKSVADILGTVFEQDLPRYDIGTYQIYRSALPNVPPTDTTYALLVIDQAGAVQEAHEDNNVYPFPIVPVAPAVQIVVARVSPATTASGVSVVSDGDTLWRKESYKVWVRATNNWNRDISIGGDWSEIFPLKPPISGQAVTSRSFGPLQISGHEVGWIPLDGPVSGDIFQHSWDWVPPTEPFSVPKAIEDEGIDLLKKAIFETMSQLAEHIFHEVIPLGKR